MILYFNDIILILLISYSFIFIASSISGKKLSQIDKRIRLINRFDRNGLSSAIKEGCLNATNEIIAIMDTDGQHEVIAITNAIEKLLNSRLDLIAGSRFLHESSIQGLSQKREGFSILANSSISSSVLSG